MKVQSKKKSLLGFVVSIVILLSFLTSNSAIAQKKNQMTRLVKIKVDSLQLDNYNVALKKQMTTAIRVEAGVLTYYAVADKKDPTQITILEIYADMAAYQSHIVTTHFRKYKDTVKDMVKSLEIMDVDVIGVAKKPGL